MKISAIQQTDYDEVLALNSESVPHVNLIGRDQLQWFDEHASFVQVAKIDERLAGFIIGLRPGTEYASPNYRWFCEHYDDFAYIDRVAVAKWARRQGIAEALYTAFANSQSGAPVLTCEVNIRPANDGSMIFHERLGFRQVGSQETDGGKKEVALMEKAL
ncbi:MAG: GNAT family N-acetyltransferase [Woeseiaceae bacterium]|nr:GNAT family N-acetyltransferase [Woeseiaceae bacterium]